jgi:FeS assembly protein IscX
LTKDYPPTIIHNNCEIHHNNVSEELFWDSSYEVARRLMEAHPGVDLENVTLTMVQEWALALSGFADDPALVNDDLLTAIYQEWYEEVNPL